VNKFILPLTALLLTSCGYSPWTTDVECDDYYQDNLQQLKQNEAETQGQLAFGVALLADFHHDLNDVTTTVERINQRNDVAFALILGDMTDLGLAAEFEWMCKAMADLKVPHFYVIGNHDSISFGKEIFSKYLAPFNYAFTYKNIKFILYNDNAFEFPEAPDYTFLENEATIKVDEVRRLTIGASHVPPVLDVHTEEEAATLRNFLFDNNFDLTVHGHHHRFFYWLDEFDSPHYITSRIRDNKYGMLFISEDDQFNLQNCEATCTAAVLEN